MIPYEIISDFKDSKCVLFIGSGVSRGLSDEEGLPTSSELTKLLCNTLLCRDIKNEDTLSSIAQEVVWKYNKSRYELQQLLKKVYDKNSLNPLRAHLAISSLNLDNVIIITTNYDRLIEKAFIQKNKDLNVIIDDGDLIERGLGKNPLIKIHGCISKPSSCVITETDYYDWLTKQSELKNYVRSLFLLKKIIFIGFSLSDINFRILLSELVAKLGKNAKPSYCVVKKLETNTYNYIFLTNELGVQFVEMDATLFLEKLAEDLSNESILHCLDIPNIKNIYLQTGSDENYELFIAKKLGEGLKESSAGSIIITEKVRKYIYELFQKDDFKYYQNIVQPCDIPINMIWVPSGEFIVGGDRHGNEVIKIGNISKCFFIDKYPVTVKEYKKFVQLEEEASHHFCNPNEPHNKEHNPDVLKDWKYIPTDYFTNPKYENYPMVCVDWWDAYAYAKWAGKRLPTELEWEKAARGIDGRSYPYGDIFNLEVSNTFESKINMLESVGKHPGNKSPWGCLDMSGNIWEWVFDKFDNNDSRPFANRVTRGGSFTRESYRSKSAYRNDHSPTAQWPTRGFRCAMDIKKEVKEDGAF